MSNIKGIYRRGNVLWLRYAGLDGKIIQAGVDLYKVQKLMRHKSPIMTQRYAHHYSESLRDGVDTLDRISTNLAQSSVCEEKKTLQAVE